MIAAAHMTTLAALAVDDDDTIRRLTASLLTRAGFNPVDQARDGGEALDLMRTRDYCVVVLDLRMPRVSGYDVLATLAGDPLPSMPKIVIATADRHAPQQNLSAEFVTAILTKPYDIETFILAVRSCLPEDA